jgi:type II secretion system (T2SS) protein M
MNLNSRDKRALVLLGVAVLIVVIWKIASSGGPTLKVAAAADSVPHAEQRLNRLRLIDAKVPAKEELFKKVSDQVSMREKGMIVADTAQQAQTQIQQILRKVGTSFGIDVRGAEFGQVRPLGSDYGEAPVSITFDCNIEQLVNLLSALGSQPEMLGTSDIRVNTGNPKDKRVSVRLTVSGVVPKKLIPEKKGVTTF